ncbi:hypothetical protein WJX72_001574 [[Myrmecia] bisecta]|uniref:Uncharacterized protein n=1 Tax=[Myrmecia] bisecta TaxID=41462 RepID=A0AAW1Q868_9CHLO
MPQKAGGGVANTSEPTLPTGTFKLPLRPIRSSQDVEDSQKADLAVLEAEFATRYCERLGVKPTRANQALVLQTLPLQPHSLQVKLKVQGHNEDEVEVTAPGMKHDVRHILPPVVGPTDVLAVGLENEAASGFSHASKAASQAAAQALRAAINSGASSREEQEAWLCAIHESWDRMTRRHRQAPAGVAFIIPLLLLSIRSLVETCMSQCYPLFSASPEGALGLQRMHQTLQRAERQHYNGISPLLQAALTHPESVAVRRLLLKGQKVSQQVCQVHA